MMAESVDTSSYVTLKRSYLHLMQEGKSVSKEALSELSSVYVVEGTKETGVYAVPVFLLCFKKNFWVVPFPEEGFSSELVSSLREIETIFAVYLETFPWSWRKASQGIFSLYPEADLKSHKMSNWPASFSQERPLKAEDLSRFMGEPESGFDKRRLSSSLVGTFARVSAFPQNEPLGIDKNKPIGYRRILVDYEQLWMTRKHVTESKEPFSLSRFFKKK